ncbi:MAG: hypothetical protein FWD66_00655 [Paludibacter sp.]|nr:hypothetical protein [Paludibacter sp.]
MTKFYTKKTVSVVLTTALFFPIMVFLSGCKETHTPDNIEGDIEIINFQQSECIPGIDNLFKDEITFVSQDSLLHVELGKIMMNCCLEGIDYEISKDNENIIINITQMMMYNAGCNCVCPYDLNFDIANLAFGTYIVQIQIIGFQKYNNVTLNYDSNTNQTNPLIRN